MAETKLSPDQVSEFKEAFSLFDKNGDGAITPKELGIVMDQLGEKCSIDDCKGMIKEVDQHESGDIDFSDFLKMMDIGNGSVGDEMKIAFSIFDKDKDGKISPDELKALMTSLGEKIADEEIKSIISVYQTTHH
mmetsp:Transcript_15772/g.25718  ORF Transcript_15772/g.25718 Transcript_15772/m.25718 type:complete len:134 (-) Transcript_15772:449-850(-)